MKIQICLLGLVGVLLFSSCGAKTKPVTRASLVGSWKLVSTEKNGKKYDYSTESVLYVFRANGVVETIANENRFYGVWRLKGIQLTAIWRDRGYHETHQIESVSKERLVLRSKQLKLISNFVRLQ